MYNTVCYNVMFKLIFHPKHVYKPFSRVSFPYKFPFRRETDATFSEHTGRIDIGIGCDKQPRKRRTSKSNASSPSLRSHFLSNMTEPK